MSFGGFSRASLAAIAVACSLAGTGAHAARLVTFDIPAQPLPSALNMLARQAGVQILFPSALVAERRAPALKGAMSLRAALSRLTAGSGLAVVQDDGQMVVLKAQTGPAADPHAAGRISDAQAPDGAPPGTSGLAPADGAATGIDQQNGIVVVGTRNQAANLKLKANNTVDVLSNEDLSHTAVHNVAEALALLPSVNVVYTGSGFFGGVDGASRGDGQFVSIRGLNGEYNVNLINGAEVAVANPYSRSVELSLIPPSGLNTIVLNKTSRADMDGDAIGGTIDFRTPSAFDYGRDTTVSLTAGGRLESRARAYGLNALGYNASGEVSHKFGSSRQFGIYVSGYYDIRHFDNSTIGGVQESGCCDNGTDFAVQDAKGNSAPGLDPAKNLFLTGANFGISNGYTRRYGGNATLDWHGDDGTVVYLRATYAHSASEQNSNLSQVVATNKQDGSAGTPIGPGLYAPVLGSVATKYWYETSPEAAALGTVQLGGSHKIGHLDIAPSIFYSWGENSRPNHIEVAAGTPGGTPFGGSTLFGYAGGYPQPLLTPAMLAAMQDIPGMSAAGGDIEITEKTSTQRKVGGQLDLRYDFDDGGLLRYIKIGGKVVDSHRMVTNRGYGVHYSSSIQTLSDLGIIDGAYSPVFPGKGYDWSVPIIDQGALFDLYNQIAQTLGGMNATLTTCGGNPLNAYNCNTQKATENVYSGYAMADLQAGNLEIIPGFRFEHSNIYNTYWFIPRDANNVRLVGSFQHNKATFDQPLPSLLLNYRPDDRTVVRGAIWTSYERPPFLELGGGSSETVSNSGGHSVVTLTVGNPNLKPITSLNLDVSAERSFSTGTNVSVAGYYKRLHHYIYDAGSAAGVTNSTGTGGLITIAPQNGGAGDVYGIELTVQQRFTAMPSPFDGLGISGNFTRQWTRVDLLGDGTRMDRIQNAPNYMANLQLFYAKGPINFDVTYSYSGSYVSTYDALSKKATWDDVWVRPVGRVGLHAGLQVSHFAKLDLSVSNLFNTETYWAHIGRHSLAVSDIVNSGTTSLLTGTIKF